MKAIRVHDFGGPDVMRLEEVPDLKAGPGEVVVRTKAIGVNPVDTYIRSGMYAAKPNLPYTPGTDAAGIVEFVGEGVNSVVVGARVYIAGTISGAYAEQALCKHTQVHRLPANASFEDGAAIGVPAAIAYRSLFQKARAIPGETLLVHGASGGAQTRGPSAVDHRAEDHLDRIVELTSGRGVDVILEMAANVNLGKDLKILAHAGRVVVIGSRGTVEIDPRDAMSREATIFGVLVFSATDREYASIHAALVAALENGTLRPVIGSQMPLADAARSHVAVMESGAYGKIILMP